MRSKFYFKITFQFGNDTEYGIYHAYSLLDVCRHIEEEEWLCVEMIVSAERLKAPPEKVNKDTIHEVT